MAVSTDVFQLTHEYTNLGQNCSNVYFYQREVALGSSAQDLVDSWVTQVLPDIRALQPSNVVTTSVSAVNLFDATDTGETLLALAGTLASAGDSLPSFLSAGFTLARDTSITRSGKKRIAGGGESYMLGNVWTGSTFLTNLQAAADAILENILDGLTEAFFPVIVKRILDGTDDYRLPETAAEAVVNAVVDVLFSLIPTTQNSRKVGVGE